MSSVSSNRLRTPASLIYLLVLAAAGAAGAEDPVYTGRFGNVAIKGYDPVAYFLDKEPVKGSADHSFEWKGAEWRFKSADNRERFAADPERWAPQYGGYCAWAVSQGYTAATDPEAWTVVGDRLFLNYNKKIRARWLEDRDGNITKADANWPAVLDK